MSGLSLKKAVYSLPFLVGGALAATLLIKGALGSYSVSILALPASYSATALLALGATGLPAIAILVGILASKYLVKDKKIGDTITWLAIWVTVIGVASAWEKAFVIPLAGGFFCLFLADKYIPAFNKVINGHG